MIRTLLALLASFIAIPLLAIDRNDCPGLTHLGTLYELRSFETLFHTADERLYEAKRLGRNRVVIGATAARAAQSAG